jgi:hypothetical protein
VIINRYAFKNEKCCHYYWCKYGSIYYFMLPDQYIMHMIVEINVSYGVRGKKAIFDSDDHHR